MQEIGVELRQAREDKGLTLEEVSSRTMIPKKYLRALENGEFHVFSGEVYLKGALRKYALELKMDPEPLLNRYSPVKPKESVTEPDKPEKPQVKPVRVKTGTKRLNTGRLVMVFLVFILLVAGIRAVGSIITSEPVTVTDPPPVTEPQDNPPPTEEPVEEDPEPPQVLVERDSRQDSVLYNVFNADSITAEISYSEPCWTRIETDGNRPEENTFSAGQSHTVTAEETIRIRIGNPPGVSLIINGQQVELPGTEAAYTFEIKNAGVK